MGHDAWLSTVSLQHSRDRITCTAWTVINIHIHSIINMNIRQKLQVFLLLLLTFFTFAAYHSGTGGTGWLQLLTVLAILAFTFVFDLAFTNESQFIFDPDADNWRRKIVSFLFIYYFAKKHGDVVVFYLYCYCCQRGLLRGENQLQACC